MMTFFEVYEAGTIVDEPGCPFYSPPESDAIADATEKIFVGGIPKGTAEDSIWQFFGSFGKVSQVDIRKDPEGQPRGFAFVTFEDKVSTQLVLNNYDNNYMDGKWLDCKCAGKGSKGGEKGGGKGKDGGKGTKDGGKGG